MSERLDPTKCPECKGPMKALFQSYFCPDDCDKPEVKARKSAELEAKTAASIYSKLFAPAPQGWFNNIPMEVHSAPRLYSSHIERARRYTRDESNYRDADTAAFVHCTEAYRIPARGRI